MVLLNTPAGQLVPDEDETMDQLKARVQRAYDKGDTIVVNLLNTYDPPTTVKVLLVPSGGNCEVQDTEAGPIDW